MAAPTLGPPLTVSEGVHSTAPLSGVKELIDNQKEVLYSAKATEAFGSKPVLERVYTQKEGRSKRKKIPTQLHENEEQKKNMLSDTVHTCLQACSGAVYDFWHWNELPGNTSSRLHTVGTRGGRGPYLLLSLVVLLVVIFSIFMIFKKNNNGYMPQRIMVGPSMSNNVPMQAGATLEQIQRKLVPQVQQQVITQAVPKMAPVSMYQYA